MKKKIKAWAILNDKKKVISIEIGRSKPKWFCIGTWQFEVNPNDLVPCEITYRPPLLKTNH